MRITKRGSMELGVNAIVILIIALAILGMGIAFVTNLFRSGSGKLGKIIDNTELPVHADSGNPLAFETSQLTIKQGKRENIKLSVYNDGFGGQNDISVGLASCTNSEGMDVAIGGDGIFLAAPNQRINPGSDAGYLAIVSVAGEDIVPVDTYICTVRASVGDPMSNNDPATSRSGQIIINVIL
ncbi:hypothetical protein JW826_03965 [Candidatus Woesearchaeota archaeon]|nr:hypothetical protein [Candidatus Woesearchaeota archaeon]